MKTKFYVCAALAIIITSQSIAQSKQASSEGATAQNANTSLSNLKPTKVNMSLVPDSNNMRSLGASSIGWKNIYYTGSLYSGNKRILATNGNSNTFLGINAGNTSTTGAFNTAIGNSTLFSNTTGYTNTALGSNTLYYNTTGYNNSASGFYSLYQNTMGYNNTASGAYALTSNTTGNENTAAGYGSLASNVTGVQNVADGAYALYNNTTGSWNTAIGIKALNANTTGQENVAIGDQALKINTTGGYNVAIGYGALDSTVSGLNNTGVGIFAGFYNGVADNTTCIGALAGGYLAPSNTIRIGNSSIIQIGGQVGWTQFSDGRMKENIKKDVPGLAFINKLNPVSYNFNIHHENEMLYKGKFDNINWKSKYDIEKKKMTGFIAQEVEKAANEVGYDFSGVQKPATPDGLYGLTYSEFVVPLVKAVQELSKINDAQQKTNEELQKQIDDLKTIVLSGNHSNSTENLQQQKINLNTASLEQNFPNPFASTTTIYYTIPQLRQGGTSAQILITDKSGKVVKQVNINTAGKGSLNIDAAMLSPGSYSYSLYADGKLTGSKQMIVSK